MQENLSTFRLIGFRPTSRPQRQQQLAEQLDLGDLPLDRDRVDLAVAAAVDLLAPARLRAGVESRDALGPRVGVSSSRTRRSSLA